MRRFQNILLLAGNTAEMNETLKRAVEFAEYNLAQLMVPRALFESVLQTIQTYNAKEVNGDKSYESEKKAHIVAVGLGYDLNL